MLRNQALPRPGSALQKIQELPRALRPQAAPGTWEVALRALGPGGRVLNAGAGRGGLSALMRDAGHEVVSVDLHPEHFMVPGMTCQLADLGAGPLPYETGSFDAVLAVEVAEHLENPWTFLREAIRLLRPGGSLVFTSPNVTSLASRISFLLHGQLPYFREASFVGCYHVTPVFPWAVERCARTTSARLEEITYSRVDWPDGRDIPNYRHRNASGLLKRLLPLNGLTGEIACYRVVKMDSGNDVPVGTHSA